MCSLHGDVCGLGACPDASVPSLGLAPLKHSFIWASVRAGGSPFFCGFPASAAPVVERRGTEMGCHWPGLRQGYFVTRETGTLSWLHSQEAHPFLLAVGVGLPCGSPFQTLPFFLLQQAQHPAPPAPCWPPCPWLPGLCSPRWTSSTCSPSTSMALPRSASSPTSARYGLGWRAGGIQPSGGWAWKVGSDGPVLRRWV